MGFLSDLFGSRVNVPKYKPVDVAESQAKGIAGNLAALPQAQELATKTTEFNQASILKMLETAIPGYSDISAGISSKIQDLQAGKIPTDVSQQVQLSDAAKALQGGYAGSGAHGNLVARDLGLTSLDLTQKGLNAAESWITMTDQMFAPGQFNVANMFLSPQFSAQSDMSENQFLWKTKEVAAEAAAAPDPITEGLTSFGMESMKGLMSAGVFDPTAKAAGAGAGGGGI